MKILLVHNHYGSGAPSGENIVFKLERRLLEDRGHDVAVFQRYSDDLLMKGFRGKLHGAVVLPWNVASARSIRAMVDEFRPDVVHVHNTFPLISPSIFHAIGYRSAKVLTLHNYRLFCPAAIPMRDGKTCVECMEARSSLPSLKYGCYRSSRLATAPLALSVGLHRWLGTWQRKVDAFIALTEFQREAMVSAGLPAGLVQVKSNFFPGTPSCIDWSLRGDYAVFVGRLTAEKGIRALVQAWLQWGESAPELRIVGDGELRAELIQMAAGSPRVPIRFLGLLSSESAQKEIANAKLVVMPSESFEGFPMVVLEAFAFGTPVAASRLGALASIVKSGSNGLLFEPASPKSLLEVVRLAWGSPMLLHKLGAAAREEFEGKYTEEANHQRLVEIYEAAIQTSNRRLTGGC